MAMLMEVTCRCGYVARGSRVRVIHDITDHARAEHDLVLTPADVRAMWRQVDESEPGVAASAES